MNRLKVAQPVSERFGLRSLPLKKVIGNMLGVKGLTTLSETNALGEHEKTLCAIGWSAQAWGCSVICERSVMEDNPGKDELEKLLKQILGDSVTSEDLSKIAGLGQGSIPLGHMLSQFRTMFSGSNESVNWNLANQQAKELAKKEQRDAQSVSQELETAVSMATLWLQAATEFQTSQTPKFLSRTGWVDDAMPLFRQLSEPVAESMAKALNENLEKVLPEELSQMLGPAKNFLSVAGASIFAMQLGQAVGKLSNQTLLGSEIGIPITNRPSFVSQNIETLIREIPTPKSEVLIYLATRELAIASLYASNRWLQEHITAQVREFAAGLKVDVEQIQNLAESIDPNDPESINQVISSGSFVTQRTEEQEAALARIELTLALIEGWADYVTELACQRLPALAAVAELFSRHRATSGALEKTFEILLGLKLEPKFRREAKLMWQLVNDSMGSDTRDSLWSHPDQLPSEQEVTNPDQLIQRLSQDGDDFDSELRKLLDS